MVEQQRETNDIFKVFPLSSVIAIVTDNIQLMDEEDGANDLLSFMAGNEINGYWDYSFDIGICRDHIFSQFPFLEDLSRFEDLTKANYKDVLRKMYNEYGLVNLEICNMGN